MAPTQLSVALGGGAGTSPPAPYVPPLSRDDSFLIWIGTGTSPAATTGTDASPTNPLATITLGSNYSSIVDESPVLKATVSFLGGAAAAAGAYAVIVTSNTIVIGCKTAPAASLPASAPISGNGGIGVVVKIDH